jgi:hypothetical protein
MPFTIIFSYDLSKRIFTNPNDFLKRQRNMVLKTYFKSDQQGIYQ